MAVTEIKLRSTGSTNLCPINKSGINLTKSSLHLEIKINRDKIKKKKLM